MRFRSSSFAKGPFGCDVDFAQHVKIYGATPGSAGRYSPAGCTGTEKGRVEGWPDMAPMSTSYVERQNLTKRTHIPRLTNAFSAKVENHAYAVVLHYVCYNFMGLHGKMRVTPAMQAGVTDRLWKMADIVALVEAADAPAAKRGTYKRRQAAPT